MLSQKKSSITLEIRFMQITNIGPQLNDLLKKAHRVLLITSSNPSKEVLISMFSLENFLKSRDKEVNVVASSVEDSNRVADKEVVSTPPPRNLVISFDYIEGSIEKVSYNVEGNKFNLVITPRGSSINPSQINYSYTGEPYDLVFVFNVADKEASEKSLANLGSDYPNSTIINIDNHLSNTLYGQINVVDTDATSLSEIMVNLLKEVEGLSRDNASLLYEGLKLATKNFSLGVKSTTLQAASVCLRVLENKNPIVNNDSSGSNQEDNPKAEQSKENDVDSSWLSPKIYKSSQLQN